MIMPGRICVAGIAIERTPYVSVTGMALTSTSQFYRRQAVHFQGMAALPASKQVRKEAANRAKEASMTRSVRPGRRRIHRGGRGRRGGRQGLRAAVGDGSFDLCMHLADGDG